MGDEATELLKEALAIFQYDLNIRHERDPEKLEIASKIENYIWELQTGRIS